MPYVFFLLYIVVMPAQQFTRSTLCWSASARAQPTHFFWTGVSPDQEASDAL